MIEISTQTIGRIRRSSGALVLTFLYAASSHAQTPPVYQAEEVVVTATRFVEKKQDYPIGVSVITKEAIENSTASTLPELLGRQAGIQVRDNSGSPDMQVDMRGFGITGDQNMVVLLDGQRLSEVELTTVKWSAIPLSAIERIEILRGSGAVQYGGGATGGVINIITKTPVPNQKTGNLLAGYGSYASDDLRAGFSVAGEKLGMTVHANDYQSDNYRANNRVKQRNLEADIRYADGPRTLALKAGVDDQDLRLPGARTAAQLDTDRRGATTPFDFTTRTGNHTNLSLSTPLGAGEFIADLAYRDKHSTASIFFFGTTFNLNTKVNVWSFAPRVKIPHRLLGPNSTLILGVDWDDWDYDSTRDFGPAHVLAHQKNQAFYAQNTSELSAATAMAVGVRAQRVKYDTADVNSSASYAKGDKTITPRAFEAALRHRLSPATTVYGKLGNSFRVATVDETYNQFGGPLFDPLVTLLEPQTSHDREIGIEHQAGRVAYRAALYHMDLTNEIHFNPVTFANENLSPTRRYGLELEGRWNISQGLEFLANYTYAIAKFRSGIVGGIDVSGRNVPLVPAHKLNLGATWQLPARTKLHGTIAYVGEQHFDGDETNTFGQKMSSYTVADVKVTHETGDWLLGASVKNLFNQKYFSYGLALPPIFIAYPAPERSMFVTAEYRFK